MQTPSRSLFKLHELLMILRGSFPSFPADVDPCLDFPCYYYAVCFASTPTTPTCICKPCPGSQVEPICDVYGVTHTCRCEYQLAVCKAQRSVPTRHLGGCKRKLPCNQYMYQLVILSNYFSVFLDVKQSKFFSRVRNLQLNTIEGAVDS